MGTRFHRACYMLNSIRQFFEQHLNPVTQSQDGGQPRLHLATAALLQEMVRADIAEHEQEMAVLAQQLRSVFGLSAEETRELTELAQQETDGAACLYQFTRLIDVEFSVEQKISVLEMLWRVAFADGDLDKYEEHLVRKLADLLHLPHREFIQARHRVEAELAAD